MDNFKALDFNIYLKSELKKDCKYVKIQSGKGKKPEDTVYVMPYEFTYIEGIIAFKYREYSMSSENKISLSDWPRILSELDVATKKLSVCTTQQEVDNILRYRSHKTTIKLETILEYRSEIIKFFSDINIWLTKTYLEDKYILIIK